MLSTVVTDSSPHEHDKGNARDKTGRTNVYFVALGGGAVVTKLAQVACPEADDDDRQQTLHC